MALTDITFGGTASMTINDFIMTEARGSIGVITDILVPAGGASSNTLVYKLPTPSGIGGEVSVTFVT